MVHTLKISNKLVVESSFINNEPRQWLVIAFNGFGKDKFLKSYLDCLSEIVDIVINFTGSGQNDTRWFQNLYFKDSVFFYKFINYNIIYDHGVIVVGSDGRKFVNI